MENTCINLTAVVSSVRLVKINGFSLTATMGNEDYVKSTWKVDGYEWEIRIYPSRKIATPDGGQWVAVELVFLSEARKSIVRTTLGCRLADPRGLLKASEEVCVSRVFSHPKECSSVVMFVGRRQLAASGYCRDDSFTMQCTIKFLKELPDTATIPAKEVDVPSPNLRRHLAQLLHSETGADVTFLVSGESFAAHRSILAARSPVFMAEFFGDMKEKCSQSVEIKDIEAAVFKVLLYFIYTDTVPEFDQKEEEAMIMAQHLLAAADRYGLDRLKLICEGKLSGGITVDTVATTLALAEQHGCQQLKEKCVEFIVSSPAVLSAVLATEGYKHLEASCPLVLADLLKSSCGLRGRS